MDRKRPYKSVILNLPVAGDVDTSTHAGEVWIKGLLPFKASDFVDSKVQTAAAEVTQIITLGASVVVTASTTYRIMLGNTSDRDADWHSNYRPVGYKSPAVLSGVAATDRMNMYLSMAVRANSPYASPLNYFVGARVQLTHVGSTPFTIPTGLNNEWDGTPVWIKGATSGSVGFVYANADSTAVLTRINVTNGIMPVVGDVFSVIPSPFNPNVSGGGGPSTAVTAIATAGMGLVIADKPDYYNAFGNRHGVTGYYARAGFVNTDFVVTRAGVYQVGQGYRLLQEVPRVETTSSNYMAGSNPSFPTNEAPVAASNYNIIDIYYKVALNDSAIRDGHAVGDPYMRIYADNAAAGYAAFAAAIAAL